MSLTSVSLHSIDPSCPIHSVTLDNSYVFLQQKCASLFCWETTVENIQFSKMLSYIWFILDQTKLFRVSLWIGHCHLCMILLDYSEYLFTHKDIHNTLINEEIVWICLDISNICKVLQKKKIYRTMQK